MLQWKDVLVKAQSGEAYPDKVIKSKEIWQKELSPEVYRVTRLRGTERPFSSEMCVRFEPGKYGCVCCGLPLFNAAEKFDSGTGWPSFTQPIKENAIGYIKDLSHGMRRIEVTCNRCDAHLGHVFPDGPKPSSLRYCINAVSLQKLD